MVRTSAEALRRTALEQFAQDGFAGVSLQRIADAAGTSKSSVLYHFDSKEALLEAALRPAVDDLRTLLDGVDLDDPTGRRGFLERFVDFLYAHRLAIAMLVNHGAPLAGTPVVDEADALVRSVSERLSPGGDDPRGAVRFGVALAGAAFALVAADRWGAALLPDDALRPLLAEVLGELVAAPAAQPA